MAPESAWWSDMPNEWHHAIDQAIRGLEGAEAVLKLVEIRTYINDLISELQGP
jgi:hypothetical protein